jgi:tripartite-type tricarboxylate transporter receptor subunit TctC
MTGLPRRLQVALLVLAATCSVASSASAEEPFYKGKRLTVMVNFAPGGSTDIEGRLFARHIAKHIDGQPVVVVQNMDGAGGLNGTAYVGEAALRGNMRASRSATASTCAPTSSSPTSPAPRFITCAPTWRPA